jgi:hypothetical protein
MITRSIEAILAEARAERRAAQVDFLMRLTPRWESVLVALALAAFVVVAWVYPA